MFKFDFFLHIYYLAGCYTVADNSRKMSNINIKLIIPPRNINISNIIIDHILLLL